MAIEAMDMAPDGGQDDAVLLARLRSEVAALNNRLRQEGLRRSTKAIAQTAAQVEELANTIAQTQLIVARIIKAQNIAAIGETEAPHNPENPAPRKRGAFKSNEEYLRARLGIPRQEAVRRFQLADATEPRPAPGGKPAAPPRLPVLSRALDEGTVSGQAATMIRRSVDGLRGKAEPQQLRQMEEALVKHAADYDADSLRLLIRHWEGGLNPGGVDPGPAELQSRQGLFYRGRRNGLHCYEINATDDQNEVLAAVYNTAANPRLREGTATGETVAHTADNRPGSQPAGNVGEVHPTGHAAGNTGEASAPGEPRDRDPDPLDGRTRQQKHLDGIVGACRAALSSDKLPSAGGRRPQVLVTIDHNDLASKLGRPGESTFSGPLSASTIRRIACDADILPLVMNGKSQILDIGRSQRLFPAYMRLAITARDKGCTFPSCTVPAPWCEVHHVIWWEHGGTTSITNGILGCGFHHHLIHEGDWRVELIDGVAWYFPPPDVDPEQQPIRNHYWLTDAPKPELLTQITAGAFDDDAAHAKTSGSPGIADADVLEGTIIPALPAAGQDPRPGRSRPDDPQTVLELFEADQTAYEGLRHDRPGEDGPPGKEQWTKAYDDGPLQPPEPPF